MYCSTWVKVLSANNQKMARWTRLELATPCVTGRYSNQLNYHRFFSLIKTKIKNLSIILFFELVVLKFWHNIKFLVQIIKIYLVVNTKIELVRWALRWVKPSVNVVKRTLFVSRTYCNMARWTRLELATPCVTGRYSNQLNYHR